MWENIELSNLQQQKKKKTFIIRTKLSYYKVFHRQSISNRNEKNWNINKSVYLGWPILDLSKTAMHEFWYDNVKQKYGENVNLCYMDTDNFVVHVKTDDIYKNIGENIKTRFDTSNFELDRPLPKRKILKSVWTNEGKLGGKIMKEFVGSRVKT